MVKANTRDVLSEGIANDFLNKFTETLNNAFIDERKFKKRLDNKGNIGKYLEYSQNIFQKISIYFSISGSTRNPIIYFIFISPSKLAEKLFDRDEKGFVFNSVYFPVRQRAGNSLYNKKSIFECAISKHAISRVILREGLKNEVFENNYSKFFKQFELIPIAVQFFSFLLHTFKNFDLPLEKINGLSIVLPSPNGLFIGEYKDLGEKYIATQEICIIKTYVDSEIFSKEQLKVHEALTKIFQEIQSDKNSPYLHPNLRVINFDFETTSSILQAHQLFYFKKLMVVKKDFLYLIAKKEYKFDNLLFYKLDKIFDRFNELCEEKREYAQIQENDSPDMIFSKLSRLSDTEEKAN